MLCSRCSTNLPEGSQFCLKCGQSLAVASAPLALASSNPTVLTTVSTSRAQPQLAHSSWRPRILLLPFGLALLAAALWVGTSESPTAQQVQEFLRWSHAETVVDKPISIAPRSSASCKFTIPQGALNVSLAGQFSVTASPRSGKQNRESKGSGEDPNPGVEAYVLTDAAFAVWSSGYSTSTLYESGPLAEAIININAPLPTGAGVYHLVFSNKASAHAKTVQATVLLRYKSWMPDAVARLKERFRSWIGM